MYSSERIDDQISKDTALELGINLNLVEMVTRFQFRTANEATHTCTSIELTDLGVFKATKSKLTRKISTFKRKYEIKEKASKDPTLTDRKRQAASKACLTITEDIAFLQKKRDSYEN